MSLKVFFVFTVLILSFVSAVPSKKAQKKNNYNEQEQSCRDVCGLCDCDGYYCEDECICECNLEKDENVQCIADMKKECDANGLEYEILMNEEAKGRFLREVKYDNKFDLNDLSKHLVILKQKRQSNSSEPVVAAAAPEDPKVAAPVPSSTPENIVGGPLSKLVSVAGLKAISGLPSRLLVDTRQWMPTLPRAVTGRPTLPTLAPVTWRAASTPAPFPTFAPFRPLVLQPLNTL